MSGPFYLSPAFWAGAGVAAGLIGAVLAAWATLRAARPRRCRIFVKIIDVKPTGRYVRKSETGNVMVTLWLISKGPGDVTAQAFHGGEPLRLRFGYSDRQITGHHITRDGVEIPAVILPVSYDGGEISIGPGLISSRQRIEIQLAASGGPGWLELMVQPLTGADVHVKRGEYPPLWRELISILSWSNLQDVWRSM